MKALVGQQGCVLHPKLLLGAGEQPATAELVVEGGALLTGVEVEHPGREGGKREGGREGERREKKGVIGGRVEIR